MLLSPWSKARSFEFPAPLLSEFRCCARSRFPSLPPPRPWSQPLEPGSMDCCVERHVLWMRGGDDLVFRTVVAVVKS